ncbi:hypothetical protein KVR01_010554 [Diaporthe batatas]|uniref:uncharacterized protein n=1 Tax=Diaporthe batatas TaxID=748121 RepID=UPI001D052392|nr:uncharacterized protein KVR01_010554 [Diaporthe batatas]KAG8159917.1 hypothetical protein KVR01_010554 [Diaporthe batatas]
MSRFNILAFCISLGAAVVQAQDASQPWALGTKVSIMAVSLDKPADASTGCPTKLADAQATPWDFVPIQANLDLGIIVASNPNPERKLVESFYLTNGVAFGTTPLAETTTRIRVDGQNVCWFRDASNGNVRLGRCGPNFPDQAFSVIMPAEGKTTTSGISTTDDGGNSNAVLAGLPDKNETPIVFGGGSEMRFCIYNTDTGAPLTTPATKEAAYTAQVTYSNLTSTSFKDGAPKSESEAPQCNWAAWGDDGPNGTAVNVQQSSSSPDCILARTAATTPSQCADDPSNGDCILHVALAFCADVPEVKQGLKPDETDAAIESCIRKAAMGPCVANPGGAACASGLFAGIAFAGGAPGGGSSSARMRRQVDLKKLFFGDPNNPDSQLSFESQFFMGIAKNLINSAASLLNMMATPFMEELRAKCEEASMWTHLFNNQTGERVQAGCGKMFATWDNLTVPHFDPSTPVEQAGSIFADVAMLLSAVGDIAEAAKATSAVDWVMSKFGLKAAQLGKEEGLVLEAVQGENTVQIFRDAGDGKAALIETEAEGEALAREVDQSAFRSCVECVEAGGLKKRDEEESSSELRPRAPLKKRFCCAPGLTLKLDVPPPPRGPRALNARTLGAVTGEDTNTVLTSMSKAFSTWYKDGKAVLGADASVDEASKVLLSTTKTITSKNSEMIGALEKLYGIDAKESYALKNWFGAKQASRMLPGLEESMAKMPYATGTVIRSTNLDAETLKMLDEGAAGIVSKGEKGVYEVQDLVINKDPLIPDAPAERKILAATMELDDAALTFNARYFFVINSKSGRLTAPFSGEWLREVDFVQGSSGKFKLIGKQELNGGAKAAAEAGSQGPFAVYYFDEVEAPTASASFTADQITQALKDANVKWEGNP